MGFRTDGILSSPNVTTPTTPPPAGETLAYPKTGGGWYSLNSAGSEEALFGRESFAGTVTTSAAGTATVTFPAGRFSAVPSVTLTPVANGGTGAPVIAEITAVNATSVSVRTTRYGGIVGFSGISAVVHVLAFGRG